MMTCQDHAYSHSEPSQRGCPTGVIEMTCQDHSYFHPEPSQWRCPNGLMEMTVSVDSEPCMTMDHHQGPSQGAGAGGSNGGVVSSTPAVSFLQDASLHKVRMKQKLQTQMPPRRNLSRDPIVDQSKTFRSTYRLLT